jgi:hypothetical protein
MEFFSTTKKPHYIDMYLYSEFIMCDGIEKKKTKLFDQVWSVVGFFVFARKRL